MVRGKFKLNEVTSVDWSKGQRLKFNAVGNDSTPDNERFHKATPTGSLEMFVDNPAAQEQFQVGKEYYVDFSPAE